jgi:translocation and assembly module TamB
MGRAWYIRIYHFDLVVIETVAKTAASPLFMSRKIVHYIAQTLIIAALLVATAFALRPLQHFIHDRMVALKHQIVLDLESATGRAISYSSISPSIFRYIEVRDLVIYGKPGERDRLLQVKRLKIYYDIFALIGGNIASAVDNITVENTHLVLDTRRDQDVIRFISSLTSGTTSGSSPALVPRITVQGKNLALNLTGPQGSVQADHIFFTFSPGAAQAGTGPNSAGTSLSLKWKSNIRVTLDQPVLSVRNLSSPVSVTATIHPAALQPATPGQAAGAGNPAAGDYPKMAAEAMVVFDQLSANTFGIVRQAFRLTFRNGMLAFRKVEDRAPMNLAGQLDLRNRTFSANLQTEDFVPSQYVSVRPPLDVIAPWLDTGLTGKASVRYDIANGKAAYAARFAASNNNRQYSDLKAVDLDIQGNERLATINGLEIRTSVGSAGFSGTVLLANMLPDGRLKISNLTAGGMEPFNADIAVTRKDNRFELSQQSLTYGGATVHNLRVTFEPYASTPSFDARFSLDSEGKSLADLSGTLAGREPAGGGSPGVESRLTGKIESLPLSPIYRIFRASAPGLAAAGIPVPAGILPPAAIVSDTVRLNADFSLVRGPNRLTISAPQFLLYDTATQNNNLALSVTANNSSVSVNNLEANYRGYSAAGHLDATVHSDGAVAFTGDLKLQDVPYSFEGTYSPGNELFITESHGLTAHVSFSRFDQVAFQIGGTDIPVPIDQRTVRFNVEISGLYTNPQTWELNVNQFSARNLPFVPYPFARF